MSSLKLIDYVFLGLALILVIRCTLRGFITEFMTLAALALGGLGSLFLYRPCAAFLRDHGLRAFVENIPAFIQKLLPGLVQNIPEILSFVLVFVVIFLAVKLVEYLLNDIIQRIRLGGVDRLFGFLFGLVEGLVMISLLLLALRLQPIFDVESLLRESFFAGLLLPFFTGPGILPPVPAEKLSAFVTGIVGTLCLKIS